MSELKNVLEEQGFSEIKTLLNSGNIIFESGKTDKGLIREEIEQVLEKKFGFPIPVLLRMHKEIKEIVTINPFKNIIISPETRLYVTFFSEKPHIIREIPYHSPDKHFSIVQITDSAAFSVLILSKEFDTTKLMAMWEKELGENIPSGKKQFITTRNWNTISKLASL